MKIVLGILISYALIYITIWLHEFGHALFYFFYKCKKNPFQISVKPTLYFSTPNPVDTEKLKTIKKYQYILACYGGIIMNLFISIIMSLLVFFVKTDNYYLNLLMYGFLLLNLSEFVSYMFIGNIYLVSDMEGIALNCPKLRIPNLIIGILVTIYYVYLFIIIPKDIFVISLIVNLLVVICFGVCRILFTYSYKKAHK